MQSRDENGTLNPVEDPAGQGTFEPVNAYNDSSSELLVVIDLYRGKVRATSF